MTAALTIALALIRAYQLLLSPFLGGRCRFRPVLLRYAIEAIELTGRVEARGWRCAAWPGATLSPFRVSIPVPPGSRLGKMESRVLLAVLLSFLVLFGYQLLFPPPPEPPRPKAGRCGRNAPVASASVSRTPSAARRRGRARNRARRRSRARRHRRERRRPRDLHDPRRRAQELAAEAIPATRAGQPLELVAGARARRTRRCPSRWRLTIRPFPRALAAAPFTTECRTA